MRHLGRVIVQFYNDRKAARMRRYEGQLYEQLIIDSKQDHKIPGR